MKKLFSYLFILTVISLLSSKVIASDDEIAKKEMLVSLPMLTDKNAAIINSDLKSTPGIVSIEVCYELNVMIITFDSKQHTEEEMLERIRNMEINSTAELLFSKDIAKVKTDFKTVHLN